jgi:hypothetical protein
MVGLPGTSSGPSAPTIAFTTRPSARYDSTGVVKKESLCNRDVTNNNVGVANGENERPTHTHLLKSDF